MARTMVASMAIVLAAGVATLAVPPSLAAWQPGAAIDLQPLPTIPKPNASYWKWRTAASKAAKLLQKDEGLTKAARPSLCRGLTSFRRFPENPIWSIAWRPIRKLY